MREILLNETDFVMPRRSSTSNTHSLRGRIGAYESWARTEDRPARTANARKTFLDRFEREADPDGKLSPAERARRAEYLRQAYFARLALKSVVARRRKAEGRARKAGGVA